MITQLKGSHASHDIWMQEVKQELADCEKRELKLLADDREERKQTLGMMFKLDAGERLHR